MTNNQKFVTVALIAVILLAGGFYYRNKVSAPVLELPVNVDLAATSSKEVPETTTKSVATKSVANLATPPQVIPSQPGLKIEAASYISIISPLSGDFSGNATIPVKFTSVGLVGPVYLYLYEVNTKQYRATQAFEKPLFNPNGESVVQFNLEKNKAPEVVPAGPYKLFVCDKGSDPKNMTCSSSQLIIHL